MALTRLFPVWNRAEASKQALLRTAANGQLTDAIAQAETWLKEWTPPSSPLSRRLLGESVVRMRGQVESALALWRERARHQDLLKTEGIRALGVSEADPLDTVSAVRACMLLERADVLQSASELRILLRSGREALTRSLRFREHARLLPALRREHAGDLSGALALYEADPNPSGVIALRRAIVLFKLQRPQAALEALHGVDSAEAAYWRGLSHATQGRLDEARLAWRDLSGTGIDAQREQVERAARRIRLEHLAAVQEACSGQDLTEAVERVEAFRKAHAPDALLEANLERHLWPRLDRRDWEDASGRERLEKILVSFFAQPDARRLHNAFVAALEWAREDATAVSELACLGSAVMVNLDRDPACTGEEATPERLRAVLRALLETLGRSDETCRNDWRLDEAAESLGSERHGMALEGLRIPPSFHRRYAPRTSSWTLPKKELPPLLASLYTPWGWALSAALSDDLTGAETLKPAGAPQGEAETIAARTIQYRRGLSLLQEGKVSHATKLLKPLRAQIGSETVWQTELDKAFSERMRHASNAQEALTLATTWREVTDSPAARARWAEEKTWEIADRLDNGTIKQDKALSELQELLRVDPKNAKALDLQRRIEEVRDIQAVFEQFSAGNPERAVAIARNAKSGQVAQIVAERLIEAALNAMDRGGNPYEARQLVVLAHQIKPHAPELREVYSVFRVY